MTFRELQVYKMSQLEIYSFYRIQVGFYGFLFSELDCFDMVDLENYTMDELEQKLSFTFDESKSYEYYNLNRIETSIRNYDLQLTESNIPHGSVLTPRIDWEDESLPVTSDLIRIENNFKNLNFNNKFIKKDWLEIMPFSHSDATRWEQQCEELNAVVDNIQKAWSTCGTIKCGGSKI